MDKILFYTNSWEEVKTVMPYYNVLLESGYEVAFSTDDVELVEKLSIGRMLVVKAGKYIADTVVSNVKLKEYPNAINFKNFLEVMQSE